METMNYHPKKSVDIWLNKEGYFRKHIALDETCLFRSVSDQLFNSQIYHEFIRKQCVEYAVEHRQYYEGLIDGDFDEYINNLRKHLIFCGNIEMHMLSKKYKCDFIVFQYKDNSVANVTNNGYERKIMLCRLKEHHFDSVYKRVHIENTAYCQSIVYNLLYKKVFKMENADAVSCAMLQEKEEKENNPLNSDELLHSLFSENNTRVKTPFPYKVAKALDPNQYRNIEFDSWNETRKDIKIKDWYFGGDDLKIGTLCLVNINEKIMECYIQDMFGDNNNSRECLVYIKDLAIKQVVCRKQLYPMPNAKPWPLPFSISRNFKEEYKDVKVNENIRYLNRATFSGSSRPTFNKNRDRNVNSQSQSVRPSVCSGASNLEGVPLIRGSSYTYQSGKLKLSNNSTQRKKTLEYDYEKKQISKKSYNFGSSSIEHPPAAVQNVIAPPNSPAISPQNLQYDREYANDRNNNLYSKMWQQSPEPPHNYQDSYPNLSVMAQYNSYDMYQQNPESNVTVYSHSEVIKETYSIHNNISMLNVNNNCWDQSFYSNPTVCQCVSCQTFVLPREYIYQGVLPPLVNEYQAYLPYPDVQEPVNYHEDYTPPHFNSNPVVMPVCNYFSEFPNVDMVNVNYDHSNLLHQCEMHQNMNPMLMTSCAIPGAVPTMQFPSGIATNIGYIMPVPLYY